MKRARHPACDPPIHWTTLMATQTGANKLGAVRLGFIGFGIMGERLLRAGLVHDTVTLVVTGAFDPSAGAAARLKSIDPSLIAFESAAAVIAASDVLHIASPPLSHLDYLDQCERAGKAALCEKPLATDVDAAAAMVQHLTSTGMRAAVNFPFVSSAGVAQMMAWMADGVVGDPVRADIEIAFKAWPRSWQMDAVTWLDARAEGGFTREVASHHLFLARRLLGALSLQSATCAYPEADKSERSITAALTAGGVPVSLAGAVGTTAKDDHNIWMLTGSKGRIRLCDWSIAERDVDGVWQAAPSALPNEAARAAGFKRQLDKVAAMTRGETTNLASLEEALDVQRAVEQILRS
jgi:predicted dehydrogenase